MINKIFPKKPGADTTSTPPPPIGIPRIAIGVAIGMILAFAILAASVRVGLEIYIPARESLSSDQQKAVDDTTTEDDYLSTP